MARHIATRDIKLGAVDGDKWIKAGTEIADNDLAQFPAGTYRTIDEHTFPDGKCPTCGQAVVTTMGAPGAIPKPDERPPSVQKDAPAGDAARQAAVESMRRRPDNADSGMPSWGKIPLDVERTILANMPSTRVVPDVAPAASVRVPPRGQDLTDDEKRRAADQAPRPNDQNMGGFGSGGETVGAGASGAGTQTAPSGDVLSRQPAVGSAADQRTGGGAAKP
jgi:hypothetical protein